ncbi:small basic family protein [Coprothermobacter platensis]|uniref:small basic family protein n=1 Tax=Coprothermobacter platensis TaxID=108819 RepID=UPI001FE0648F|nr:small basic family protein [Coprothermobacter platensis]
MVLAVSVVVIAGLGFYFGMHFGERTSYSSSQVRYVGVLVLVVLDAVFGGIRAEIQDMFDIVIFTTGIAVGGLVAVWLLFLGDLFGIDLSLAAVVTFGGRIFQNVSIIRRILIEKIRRAR